MNSKFISAAFISIVLLASCTKNVQESGSVLLGIEPQENVTDVVTKSSVADYTTLPSASDFSIELFNSNGDVVQVADFTDPLSLPAGTYTATATYGSLTDEGFDKPCFSGSKTFTVTGGANEAVNIPVKLAGCIVRLDFTENFRNYYTDYTFTLTTGNGTVIQFPKSETRAAFMDAYMVKVSGTLVNQAGVSKNFGEKEFRNLAPATCYTMKFDVSNVGDTGITISFNDIVTDVELPDMDLNE